jgi:CheY-like chemotaxis protein
METHRILLVEDDPETRAVVRDLLLRNGYSVQTAGDGRDALARLLDDEQPALIILDLRMPKMDGLQLLTVARAYYRLAAIPALLLSAVGLPPALRGSVAAVVQKPFDPEHLLAEVQRLVPDERTTSGVSR